MKVGDVVRVKSYEWYKSNCNEKGWIEIGPGFTAPMSRFCGKKMLITDKVGMYYQCHGNLYSWVEEFFKNNEFELE